MEAKSPLVAKSPPLGPPAPLPGPAVGPLPVKAPPVTPPWQANTLRNEQLANDEFFVRVYVLRLLARATQ